MQIKSSKKMSLLEALQQLAPDSSKNTLRSWIEQGRVSIDEKKAERANQMVEEGQEVVVNAKSKFLPFNLKIVYEDADLVVIDKPAGLLSVATDMDDEPTAHGLLKERFHNPKVFPIHRLDRETSGLLVFAYTPEARQELKEQLKERTMHREYRALVHGHPGKGTWHSSLREDPAMRVHTCAPAEGKEAITHFETIRKQGECSLLKLRLQSGRKHQIRVQAADAGFPVVGDQKYGPPEDEGKKLQLRAVAIRFEHPRTKKLMFFTTLAPEEQQ